MGSYEDRVNREIEKAESKPKRWLPEGDMSEARVGPYVRFSEAAEAFMEELLSEKAIEAGAQAAADRADQIKCWDEYAPERKERERDALRVALRAAFESIEEGR